MGTPTLWGNSFDTRNSVISTSSSSPALRITQTGTGNALVVEDSTSPDSSPFVVDASGKAIIGNTASIAHLAVASQLQIYGTSSGVGLTTARWANDASQGYSIFSKSRGTTVGTYGTAVQSGDAIHTLLFAADDGVQPIRAATITCSVDGTPALNDMPGRLVFSVTADGSSSPTEAMRIDNAKNITMGGSSTAPNFKVSVTASAVNYAQVFGNTTGVAPTMGMVGSDSNISVSYYTKGSGTHLFRTDSALTQFVVSHTASAVNYLQVNGAATGSSPVLSAQGSDADVDLALTPKGTGALKFGTWTTNADAAVNGYITIKDAAGNVRKLATIA